MKFSKTFIKRTLKAASDTVTALSIGPDNLFGDVVIYPIASGALKVTSVIQKQNKGRLVTDLLTFNDIHSFKDVDYMSSFRNGVIIGTVAILSKIKDNQYMVTWATHKRHNDQIELFKEGHYNVEFNLREDTNPHIVILRQCGPQDDRPDIHIFSETHAHKYTDWTLLSPNSSIF